MRAGSSVVGVPAAQVGETMRPLPVEPLAGAPPFVAGLAVIRGEATPVLDVAALLQSGPASPPSASGRYVTLHVGNRNVALSVDAVLALRAIPRADCAALPPLWQGPRPPAVAGLATLDRELLAVLETTCLLPEEWAAAGGGGR